MNRNLFIIIAVLIILPLAFFGCRGKTETVPETELALEPTQEAAVLSATEPLQGVSQETIPPTAAPQGLEAPQPIKTDRDRDIQRALKNAGFYTGAVDGIIGPKTRRAIEDFQRAKGLKVDGKVGPKTWAEMEKYLTR